MVSPSLNRSQDRTISFCKHVLFAILTDERWRRREESTRRTMMSVSMSSSGHITADRLTVAVYLLVAWCLLRGVVNQTIILAKQKLFGCVDGSMCNVVTRGRAKGKQCTIAHLILGAVKDHTTFSSTDTISALVLASTCVLSSCFPMIYSFAARRKTHKDRKAQHKQLVGQSARLASKCLVF
jgi:hypothetical protein